MKKYFLAISCLVSVFVFSQDNRKAYKALIEKGRGYYFAKDYINAAHAFSAAVNLPGIKVPIIDWHRAAWSQALASNPDSAFYYLRIIATITPFTFSDFILVAGDEDYTLIHNDSRWIKLRQQLFDNARNTFYSVSKPTIQERSNAAFSWLLLNKPDSAFSQLSVIADAKELTFDDVNLILHNDIDAPFNNDNRWKESVKKFYTALNKKYIPVSSFNKAAAKKTILIDQGHHNVHNISGTYAVLAGTLRQAGLNISAHEGHFSSFSLAKADMLIIASPFPDFRDSLVARAARAGEPFRWSSGACQSAFAEDEIQAITEWVRNGGALLLILDHAPHGKTGGLLAAAFGVECRNVTTYDRTSRDPYIDTTEAATILFTRNKGLIGNHAILNGVDSLTTYTGGSLSGPSQSTPLLLLPSTAMDMDWDPLTRKYRNIAATGRVQALAFEYGRGRVVVLGEAAMTNPEYTSRANRGNWQFTLNILRWLTGSLP
jgi:hypothetical protein